MLCSYFLGKENMWLLQSFEKRQIEVEILFNWAVFTLTVSEMLPSPKSFSIVPDYILC